MALYPDSKRRWGIGFNTARKTHSHSDISNNLALDLLTYETTPEVITPSNNLEQRAIDPNGTVIDSP